MSCWADTVSRMKSKLTRVLLHLVGVAGDDDLVGTQPQRILHLARRRGEDDHVGTEGAGQLHAHVAQPAETDDADLLALGDTRAAQRRVGRDPGDTAAVRLRRGSGWTDAEDEALVHDDAVGVAAVGDRGSPVPVGRVERERQVRAEVLSPSDSSGRCGPSPPGSRRPPGRPP